MDKGYRYAVDVLERALDEDWAELKHGRVDAEYEADHQAGMDELREAIELLAAQPRAL